jgi:drug/metabolite transporter (DMT)-like permease
MLIDKQFLKVDLLLLITAAIWGFAFVAQRTGMEHVGPFTFNGVRFLLGTFSLLPVLYLYKDSKPDLQIKPLSPFWQRWGSFFIGLLLFTAMSLQQVGMLYTTAGKAGFITGLYVVLVPVFGLMMGQNTSRLIWMGAAFAGVGLYLLSINHDFRSEAGDLLVFISAIVWAWHMLALGWLSPHHNPVRLSMIQFGITGIFSLIIAFCIETVSLSGIYAAAIPILYGGIMSVGVAFTLQVIVQKKATPARAAIIMSLETVFAVFGGWLLLNEQMGVRALSGCVLMLTGMLVAQYHNQPKSPKT